MIEELQQANPLADGQQTAEQIQRAQKLAEVRERVGKEVTWRNPITDEAVPLRPFSISDQDRWKTLVNTGIHGYAFQVAAVIYMLSKPRHRIQLASQMRKHNTQMVDNQLSGKKEMISVVVYCQLSNEIEDFMDQFESENQFLESAEDIVNELWERVDAMQTRVRKDPKDEDKTEDDDDELGNVPGPPGA